MRAGKSPFLNATSFDLSQGSVLSHHTKAWRAPALSHVPTTLIALGPSALAPSPQSHHHNLVMVLHVVGSHISRNSKKHAFPGMPDSSSGTSSHHSSPMHFTQRYFITALLPKSPFCMSDAQELCSNSKHRRVYKGPQRGPWAPIPNPELKQHIPNNTSCSLSPKKL